jgi:RTX calcium-binding nonapeptide repeat (4 copies)
MPGKRLESAWVRKMRGRYVSAGIAFAGLAAASLMLGVPASARDTVNGTGGDDRLRGTAFPDTIRGFGGRDRIFALAGADLAATICPTASSRPAVSACQRAGECGSSPGAVASSCWASSPVIAVSATTRPVSMMLKPHIGVQRQ